MISLRTIVMRRYFFSTFFLLFLMLPVIFCKYHTNSHTITILEGGEAYATMMYLNHEHWTWGMNILENTLDDTAKIGIVKISPQRTGSLFRTECLMDSLQFFTTLIKQGGANWLLNIIHRIINCCYARITFTKP